LRKFKVAYFTASCDDAETNTRFAKSLDLDYAILSDPTKETAKAYGNPRRATFIIGANGKILHIDNAVQTGTHGEDIAKKLEELGVPKRDSE
jgi:peroxiredoxin Q/BCP